MTSSKKQSGAYRSDVASALAPDAVHRRFAKAFPELEQCFSWLNGGYAAGAEWESLLLAYRGRLSVVRAERLRHEAHDALRLGLSDRNGLDVLVSSVLGLDSAILRSEYETPAGVLRRFEQIVPNPAA